MRKILIALVALFVLGGGAAGGYFYFMKSAEAAPTEGEHGDEHAKKEKKKSHNDHYEFVELDPLILPIIDENGVSQTVSLVVAIEVADAATAAKVEGMSPRLTDAFIQDMYGVLNKQAALKGGVIQVGVLKEKLNKASHRILGDDVVQDVLLQVVQQRPI